MKLLTVGALVVAVLLLGTGTTPAQEETVVDIVVIGQEGDIISDPVIPGLGETFTCTASGLEAGGTYDLAGAGSLGAEFDSGSVTADSTGAVSAEFTAPSFDVVQRSPFRSFGCAFAEPELEGFIRPASLTFEAVLGPAEGAVPTATMEPPPAKATVVPAAGDGKQTTAPGFTG